MKRTICFSVFCILISSACSASLVDGSTSQMPSPGIEVDNASPSQPPPDGTDFRSDSAESGTLLPTPPTDYRFRILSQGLIAVEGGTTWSGVKCGKMLAFAAGLAINENDIPLFSPDIYLEAYDDDQLVDRIYLYHGTGKLVMPGEKTIFTSDRPKCRDFTSLTQKGVGLSDVRYEIVLFSKPIPDYYSSLPYRDMEIVSVSEQRREDGTVIKVTVANTGSGIAYPYLNYVFYDENGVPVDANVISVYTDAEPWDALYPGTQGTVTLFMELEGVDYELFLLGETPKDG